MAEAVFKDVEELAQRDRDVEELVQALRKILLKYGAFLTTRIFAGVLAPYKRRNFEDRLQVEEEHLPIFECPPSELVRQRPDVADDFDAMGLDHTILWKRDGQRLYLTSEPYFVGKEQLKALIAHCDEYGIDFQIDAESCYYPGHTIRILCKKDCIEPYDALQQMNEAHDNTR
ncbi:MAG TPA: hypothetical protein VKR06_03980 [Ktedonosporobacter sp.]|nr:hypothetical protein [Ktedonosporobacter sp.]